MNKAITVNTGQTHVQRYLGPLRDQIASGNVDPSFVVTHGEPLEKGPELYESFNNKDDCTKVVLRPRVEASLVYGVQHVGVVFGHVGLRRLGALPEGVDPTGGDLDITGHMGEVVLGTEEGETLSEEVRDRLAALDELDVGFDCSLETWDSEEDDVKYREARLEPGEAVHVTGAAVESRPEEWGSGVEATVEGESTDDRFLISRGTESEVIRRQAIQFVTGVIVGLGALAVGVRALWLALGL